MRISELAEATGISVQTIHYYLREGLLPPPLKTARNMAYYGSEYVEDIRLIKELQEKRYLPLGVIKLALETKRRGKPISDIQNMSSTLEEIFRPLGPGEDIEPVALVELVVMTGLPATTLETLEKIGILMPDITPQGKRYDGLDVRIARSAKRLLDAGLSPEDLGFCKQYIEALWAGASVIHEKVFHRTAGDRTISGGETKEMLDNMKDALDARVYRKMIMEVAQRREDTP